MLDLLVSSNTSNISAELPKLSEAGSQLLAGMANDTGIRINSENSGVSFVSRAVSKSFIPDATLAAATIEGAAQVAAVAGVASTTLGASTVSAAAATSRTSLAIPRDNARSVALNMDGAGNVQADSGLSAGSGMKNGIGLWLMPLYQNNSVHGMKSGDFETGYNSDLFGLALGVDYTIDSMIRFGLALNLGTGTARSTGDFNYTQSKSDFWGISAYAGWVKDNFGLTGDVGYTSSFTKAEQNTPAALQVGKLESDIQSSAWTVGIRGEYKIDASALDITPHIGVRYTDINTYGYSVEGNHGTVFDVDNAQQSLWTFPAGVTLSKDIETSCGWMITPKLELGVIAAAGNLEAKSRTRIPGVGVATEMETKVVDAWTFDSGVGLEVKKDNIALGVNYNLQLSEHRTGHGVFGTLRYEF